MPTQALRRTDYYRSLKMNRYDMFKKNKMPTQALRRQIQIV